MRTYIVSQQLVCRAEIVVQYRSRLVQQRVALKAQLHEPCHRAEHACILCHPQPPSVPTLMCMQLSPSCVSHCCCIVVKHCLLAADSSHARSVHVGSNFRAGGTACSTGGRCSAPAHVHLGLPPLRRHPHQRHVSITTASWRTEPPPGGTTPEGAPV